MICLSVLTGYGCGLKEDGSKGTAASSLPVLTTVAEYRQRMEERPDYQSVTAAFRRSYTMDYGENQVSGIYDLDGVMQETDLHSEKKQGHLKQYIHSGGIESSLDGYYTDGRLYNTYNQVQYYEDMDFHAFEESALVPLSPIVVKDEQLASMEKEDENTYVLHLSKAGAQALFTDVYDVYGLKEYDAYEVVSGVITQAFDEAGNVIREETDFESTVQVNAYTVRVMAQTQVHWTDFNATTLTLSDQQKEHGAAYVNFADIDTNAISSETIPDDEAEATIAGTFRKRLVNRLSYKKESEDIYTTNFNENESYTIDFAHDQFLYKNRSSTYVYNWKGDTGGFGAVCNYDFHTDTATENCDESVREMIQNVKQYFMMELYYCGLSLDDLQDETK